MNIYFTNSSKLENERDLLSDWTMNIMFLMLKKNSQVSIHPWQCEDHDIIK